MQKSKYHIRFMQQVKLTTEEQQRLFQILQPTMESAWILGCIPWYGWKMPVLKELCFTLSGQVSNDELDYVLDALSITMTNVTIDTFRLPIESDKDQLLSHMKSVLHEDEYKELEQKFIKTLGEIRGADPFNYHDIYGFTTELERREFSVLHEKSIYFHCSVLTKVLEALTVAGILDDDILALISYFSCVCVLVLPLHIPSVYSEVRQGVDDGVKSVSVYNFWSWQYTQRNSRYKEFLSRLQEYHGPDSTSTAVNVLDLFEHFDLSLTNISPGSLSKQCGDTLGALRQECIEASGYSPTWPISYYTSDLILRRIIGGEFRFYECDTPSKDRFLRCDIYACTHDPATCTRLNSESIPCQPKSKLFQVCNPECLEAISKIEFEKGIKIVHKERHKIRNEKLHRMIGIWLWDHCQTYNVPVQGAINALTVSHFPENNPNWKPNKINESKARETWHDYRERLLDKRLLYHDYAEACRCIEAGKFLSKRTRS